MLVNAFLQQQAALAPKPKMARGDPAPQPGPSTPASTTPCSGPAPTTTAPPTLPREDAGLSTLTGSPSLHNHVQGFIYKIHFIKKGEGGCKFIVNAKYSSQEFIGLNRKKKIYQVGTKKYPEIYGLIVL